MKMLNVDQLPFLPAGGAKGGGVTQHITIDGNFTMFLYHQNR
jgi:hypothetical protein